MTVSIGQQRRSWVDLLRGALIYGGGGALFCLIVLWFMQAIPSSRVVNTALELSLLLFGFLVVGFVGWAVFFWALRISAGKSILIVAAWILTYLILWFGARLLHMSLSLPVFAGAWLLLGLALASAVGEGGQPAAKPHQRMARPASRVAQASSYGRIPADTVLLLTKFVRDASGPALLYLPNDAPDHIRQHTTRAVAETMMRDWWGNGNIDGLGQQDIADIQSFVALAAAVAIGVGGWQHATACATYRATLAALLDDWLHNWNDQADGPPKR